MKNIKLLRAEQNITQYELQKRTGIGQSTLSLIENKYKVPKDDEKSSIAKVLNTNIEKISWE